MRKRGVLIAVTVAAVLVVGHGATAQLRAAADPDPPLGVAMSFTAETSFGRMTGNDVIGADVSDGGVLVTLFPNQPPFTHCTLHAFHESQFFVQRIFSVLDGLTDLRVTISNLRVRADGPIRSEIGSNGELTFVGAPMVLTGTIEMYEDFVLSLDLTESFSATLDPFAATVHQSNGFVTFEVTDIPVVVANVNPTLLPFDVTSLTYGVAVGHVRFEGPATLTHGDADAGGDVDLFDFGEFDSCFSGHDVEMDVYCGVFDFDEDGDVDLIDWSALQAAFGMD